METKRRRLAAEQAQPGFCFIIGDVVEVADYGCWWKGVVSKVLTNASDGIIRYNVRFPGHRQWSMVIYQFVLITVKDIHLYVFLRDKSHEVSVAINVIGVHVGEQTSGQIMHEYCYALCLIIFLSLMTFQ